MVTIGMNYQVLPGKEQAFETVFFKVLDKMKEMSGHRESHLYRDVAAANSYLIVSDWSDKAEFDAFIASDQFRSVANWGKEQILAGRPRHQVYSHESA